MRKIVITTSRQHHRRDLFPYPNQHKHATSYIFNKKNPSSFPQTKFKREIFEAEERRYMGLLSNRIGRESLKPGDHIYSWRAGYIYAHHGIYVGDDRVIHFTRRRQEAGTGAVLDLLMVSSSLQNQVLCEVCVHQQDAHGVVSSCLNCFLAGGILYRFEYSVSRVMFLAKARPGTCTLAASDPADVVIHRAKFLLDNGFGCYDVFKKNCEDFAVYCKTELLADDNGNFGVSGQALSTVGIRGPLGVGAILSMSLRLTNVYGIAATAVTYCATRYATDISMRSDVKKVPVEDLPK